MELSCLGSKTRFRDAKTSSKLILALKLKQIYASHTILEPWISFPERGRWVIPERGRWVEPWILKILPVGSFSNSSVATIKQNGVTFTKL